MSNKDEFDVDLDENADEGFDEVSLDEETAAAEAQPAKKKSGGGLVSVIAILAVLGGGTFAAVKFFGVQLPFNIPGLTPTEQVAQQTATPVQSEMTATADLPQDSLPPQPEIPAADSFAAGEGLPGETTGDVDAATAEAGPTSVLPDLGISAETSQDADITPPWGETAPATTENAPADAPATIVGNNNAADNNADNNIVDPFAVGTQDVTAAVNSAGHAAGTATQATPVGNAEVVDPFAVGATPADTSAPVAAETTSATATTPAPAADAAPIARTSELEKKVADLEKSLADAEKALKKANDDLASTQKQLSEKTDALTKATTNTKAATTKSAETQPAAAAETAVKADKEEAKPAAKKAATAAAPARKAWVLRSAKPGVAWVSEKGSNEMRTISVGDTLSGIGKVTAITTDAQGRWVVNGTRGTINQ